MGAKASPQFLADESCDFSVVRRLRASGFDIKAVIEVSPGSPDERVIELALGEQRVLITEDRDFGRLVRVESRFGRRNPHSLFGRTQIRIAGSAS